MSISDFNSVEDLAFSRSFRNWVLNREPGEKGFWESWVAHHPDKAEMVQLARALIYALETGRGQPTEDDIEEEVRKALVRLRDAPRYLPADGPDRPRTAGRLPTALGMVAAALFAGIVLAGFLFFRAHSRRNVLRDFLAAHQGDEVFHRSSGTRAEDSFRLPDGGLVRLARNSSIYLSTVRNTHPVRREIYLEGEAYFEIRQLPSSPWYVFTADLVSRVAGGSLVIQAYPAGPPYAITVLTGKASVFRAEDVYAYSIGARPGIVLTRNQKAVEDRRTGMLFKTIADTPGLPAGQRDTGLVFRGTPVREVFSRLEALYGIPILFDAAGSDSLLVTVNLDRQPFYRQLNTVCDSIGGSFESMDGNILVTLRGRR